MYQSCEYEKNWFEMSKTANACCQSSETQKQKPLTIILSSVGKKEASKEPFPICIYGVTAGGYSIRYKLFIALKHLLNMHYASKLNATEEHS